MDSLTTDALVTFKYRLLTVAVKHTDTLLAAIPEAEHVPYVFSVLAVFQRPWSTAVITDDEVRFRTIVAACTYSPLRTTHA
ncbi:hypothetical protein D7252_07980 [Microbacterium sp. CGR2]|nr:hypothetical protein D7252_07980 [Microbacterium sp. CGR2]